MGKNGPLGRGDDGRGTRVRVVGPSRARPAALKGATGRIGKIPTYVKCPVPLTVRGTQALVSFAPLAFKLFYAARQNAVLRRSPFPSP